MRLGATALAAAAFAALAVPSAMRQLRGGDAMPQVVKGEGALAVAFGDARGTISRALVHKADTYYHGGIDVDCDHLGSHNHDEHGEGDHHVCHEGEHGHDDDLDDHDGEHEGKHCFSDDPWAWINEHVRAPEIHRHLAGAESVEMMPWFWASVKADPHNIDAWTTAWFIADSSMKDKQLALRVVSEGLGRNPDDPELLVCRGRTFYDRGRGDIAAARKAFSAAVEAADRILRAGVDPADERIIWARRFATAYLDRIEKKSDSR